MDLSTIAFYLPQFHPVKENDDWWEPGFTEWTNVTRARKFYPGHWQPRQPSELGFYDLRLDEVREQQAELAAMYEIQAFCYYHYWFNGRRILEYPINRVLATGRPAFPFLLAWANEDWTRAWDGGSGTILMHQEYSPEDDAEHFRVIAEYMKSDLYFRFDGKPVFLIYRSSQLPDSRRTTDLWRAMARKMGLGELYLLRIESFPSERNVDPVSVGFDAAVDFAPDWRLLVDKPMARVLRRALRSTRILPPNIYSYTRLIKRMGRRPQMPYLRWPCVTPRWDNSARRGERGPIFVGSSPERYRLWVRDQVEKLMVEHADGSALLFVNAWNEWGEGAYLEPDRRFGREYLEAHRAGVCLKD